MKKTILWWTAALALALTACGPDPSSGRGDNGNQDGGILDGEPTDDGTVDGQPNQDSHVCNDQCNLNDHRCNGDVLEVCISDDFGCKVWDTEQDCTTDGKYCDDTNGTPACLAAQTCDDGIQNQDETDVDCGGTCDPCATGAQCNDDDDCESGACSNGTCVVCHAGTYHCFGNYLKVCADDESDWNDADHCDPTALEVCDAVNGTCTNSQPIGNGPDNPTGTYYLFTRFTPDNSEFRGGQDVDCLNEHCFVNAGGGHVDEYTIELLDSDGDGLLEPNQHPDNPDNPGPVEERVLTYVQTYDVPLSSGGSSELYITPTDFFFTSPDGVYQYDRASGQTQLIAPWSSSLPSYNETLGYDDVHQLWYTSVDPRHVFSWDGDHSEWVLEFSYPNLAGSHNDGLEVVTDPNTNIPYVYVSDMTSDFIGQYLKHADGHWEQVNLFQYNETNGDDVEGMGFGALSHFWACSWESLYEIGGGDLSHYTGTWDPTHM